MESEPNPFAPPSAAVADSSASVADEQPGRGRRLAGAIIDTLVVVVPILLAFFITPLGEMMVGLGEESLEFIVLGALLGFVVFFAFNGVLLATAGQTIGKRVLGMRIVDARTGRPVPFLRLAVLRYMVLGSMAHVPVLGEVSALVNALFIFRDDRRCVHDLLAGTRVVRVAG